ncbi:MAG TPA: hypothetical protein P5163_05440 [Rubrivivax sp.]|nr:hypothetical protein [Rubrivivax sp.]HRY86814.1 hypothetical protein [Rubrivivax sp.]HRZ60018.1 hypothetical protein [Rubrivivax sp.]
MLGNWHNAPPPALAAAAAALRVMVAAALLVMLHAVDRLPAWWLALIGAASLALWVRGARLRRDQRLALWIVLAVMLIIGYLHNANTWQPDGKGLLRPTETGLWKTELVLAVALAVPLIHTVGHRLRPRLAVPSGQLFAREFALYINFSGIALALWDGDARLSQAIGATLLGWVALAELTLFASD